MLPKNDPMQRPAERAARWIVILSLVAWVPAILLLFQFYDQLPMDWQRTFGPNNTGFVMTLIMISIVGGVALALFVVAIDTVWRTLAHRFSKNT